MQDFAHLFPDSVAAWLRGGGDGRFQRYEQHYRSDRASAPSIEAFDLETSNLLFAQRPDSGKPRLAAIVHSKTFSVLATFLIFMWCGSLLLSTVGTTQPIAAGAALGVLFVGMRASRSRANPQCGSKRLRNRNV
jgi:hypothetical protein